MRPDAAIERLRRTMASVISFRLGPGRSPRTESSRSPQAEVSMNAIPAWHAEITRRRIIIICTLLDSSLSSEIPHCSQRSNMYSGHSSLIPLLRSILYSAFTRGHTVNTNAESLQDARDAMRDMYCIVYLSALSLIIRYHPIMSRETVRGEKVQSQQELDCKLLTFYQHL